ncbi:alpha/beta hydrolase [soil metagenome]
MRTELDLDSHGTRCAAWLFPATAESLTGPRGRPCVVMWHGFGATKDAGLEPFAERFAAAGADVLVFDYRGFGRSDGDLRQDVDHRRHREDYASAVEVARTLPGVDPERVVLWGSSYSGGHVVAVAADDPRLAGVISQGAAMDGLAAVALILRYAGPRQLLRLTGHAVLDAVGARLGRAPHLIPVVGPPGSLAAITSEGAEVGYQAIMGPTFRNEMCARGILRILVNRPVRSASRLRMPSLFVVAQWDNVAPPGAVRTAARRAGRLAQVESYDVGHFDIYLGGPFERSVDAQVRFLSSL